MLDCSRTLTMLSEEYQSSRNINRRESHALSPTEAHSEWSNIPGVPLVDAPNVPLSDGWLRCPASCAKLAQTWTHPPVGDNYISSLKFDEENSINLPLSTILSIQQWTYLKTSPGTPAAIAKPRSSLASAVTPRKSRTQNGCCIETGSTKRTQANGSQDGHCVSNTVPLP